MHRRRAGHGRSPAAGVEAPGAARLRPALALLHYTAPPTPGGVEAILGAHAALLREAGYEVRVIAGRGEAELVPELDSRHPEVERLARTLAAGGEAGSEFAVLRARLRRRLEALLARSDLAIAHNVLTMPFHLPLAAVLAERAARGRPLLAWTHDLAWVNPLYAAFRRPGPPYDLLHRAQPGVTYVAISEVRRRELCATFDVPAATIPVVPNGLAVEEFLGIRPATRELLARSGLAGASPLVLVPVRITPRKRIELALRAAALLLQRHPGLGLLVSGPLGPHSAGNRAYDRSLHDERRRLGLEGRVSFLHELAAPGGGHPVDAAMIAELYRLADAVLLPSESEGFGLPVLEAAVARTPIVCADLEVLKEAAGGGGPHTFPAGEGAEAVAAALERALAEPAALMRRRVVRRNAWPPVLEQLETVIMEAMKAGGGG